MKLFFIILLAILTALWFADAYMQAQAERRELEHIRAMGGRR